MIVVSDSSPLNVLVRIGYAELLPQLFGTVIIPPAVAGELSHPKTPPIVRTWLESKPVWLRLTSPKSIDPTLDFDDPGEREAISLALELRADRLLADDKRARRAAQARGLAVTGVLGVLELGSARSLVDFPDAVRRLRNTDFLIAERLIDAALLRDARRKSAAHDTGR